VPESQRPPEPSRLFVERLDALRDAGRLGPVVDLACGRGRHAIPGVRAALPLIGVDRNAAFLSDLRARAEALGEDVPCIRADLESGHEIPIRSESCGAVLVFRFLFRPLAPEIVRLLAPGGILLYETFTWEQRSLPYGPNDPAFLLGPGELPSLFPQLEVLSHEELREGRPRPDAIARLVARKPLA
jgi:tellurite methyltransferase